MQLESKTGSKGKDLAQKELDTVKCVGKLRAVHAPALAGAPCMYAHHAGTSRKQSHTVLPWLPPHIMSASRTP